MTPHHDPEDWLRVTFARSRDAFPISQAPVDQILAVARTRRKRRRAAAAAAMVGAACVLAVGLTLAPRPPHLTVGPAQQSFPAASPTATATPGKASARVGEGTVDGQRWSVALEFYPTLPEGFTLPTQPDGTTVPGTSLLCQRMYIGGVRIDHQGGRWSDCQPVNGAHDPQGTGSMGLWGLQDKGTSGTRLMVANPEADVAYGVLTFSDGSSVKAATVGVPGTDYRAWAAPIPNGKMIATVDQYDTHHHRLSHDTNWR
ncbi:hypothetical protein [Streptomyces sp. NPDC056821]|uniref:hypothetical protein n=1 Tax=unclassified Streptomyces TaxID=2593676 RepID=UPI0036C992AE